MNNNDLNNGLNNNSNIPNSTPNNNLNDLSNSNQVGVNSNNMSTSQINQPNTVQSNTFNSTPINNNSISQPQPNSYINTQQDVNNTPNTAYQNNGMAANPTTPSQNNYQSNNSINYNNDDELVRAFIGNNYDKITTRPFNFAGFFLSTLYMFYRKMFLYGFIAFIINLVILNVINNFFVSIAFNVLIGFFINKIYLSYVNNKINKIKAANPQKTPDEIKGICSSKGGTSVGKVFLGLFLEFLIALVIVIVMAIAGFASAFGSLFNPNNWDITINGNDINNEENTNNSNSSATGTLVEDVTVGGYSCFNSKCTVSIESGNDEGEYVFNANNIELFKTLSDYNDYIKVNIYYSKKGQEKTINKYEIFIKSTNENISNIKNEDELRTKIGLYTKGTHTDSFTLKEIGTPGFGYKDDTAYTYIDYTFVDGKNNEYEMKYIMSDGSNSLNLVEGNRYNVTFEVVEGTLGYEFNIKSIK